MQPVMSVSQVTGDALQRPAQALDFGVGGDSGQMQGLCSRHRAVLLQEMKSKPPTGAASSR